MQLNKPTCAFTCYHSITKAPASRLNHSLRLRVIKDGYPVSNWLKGHTHNKNVLRNLALDTHVLRIVDRRTKRHRERCKNASCNGTLSCRLERNKLVSHSVERGKEHNKKACVRDLKRLPQYLDTRPLDYYVPMFDEKNAELPPRVHNEFTNQLSSTLAFKASNKDIKATPDTSNYDHP